MIRPLTIAHTQIATNASYERLPRAGSAITRRARLIPQKCPVFSWSGSRTRLELLRRSDWRHPIACIAQGFRSADETAKGVGDAKPDKRPCNQYRYPSYPAHEAPGSAAARRTPARAAAIL